MQKAFGHDPVGWSGVPSNADDCGPSSAVAFSGAGSGTQADNSNQADSYAKQTSPGYIKAPSTQNNTPVETEFAADSTLAPTCVRGFDY